MGSSLHVTDILLFVEIFKLESKEGLEVIISIEAQYSWVPNECTEIGSRRKECFHVAFFSVFFCHCANGITDKMGPLPILSVIYTVINAKQ